MKPPTREIPRDATVSRPSYYTEQHQAFLDKLASNGSAELVWLFEELLEEFELGPAAAERIVRYWRASR